jgi:GNAT superfamily N-acetyltransferase
MAEVICRAATPDDLETLGRLRWEMQLDEMHGAPGDAARDPAPYVATYRAELGPEFARGRARAWLAEVDGEAAAAVTLLWWVVPPSVDLPRRRRGQISNVYTRPAHRRRGLSRRLLTLLIAEARALGVQRLVLWPSEMGEPLYAGLGFAPSRGMELNL